MTPSDLVTVAPQAREAFDVPPALPVGAFYQLASGEVVRVEVDGCLEALIRGGMPWGRSAAWTPGLRGGTP